MQINEIRQYGLYRATTVPDLFLLNSGDLYAIRADRGEIQMMETAELEEMAGENFEPTTQGLYFGVPEGAPNNVVGREQTIPGAYKGDGFFILIDKMGNKFYSADYGTFEKAMGALGYQVSPNDKPIVIR